MKTKNILYLIILFLVTKFSYGQIPKGHFIDADKTAKKGYKIKPFIQKEKEIYHYAVLTELPFENKCGKELSEKEKIDCSETYLRSLIFNEMIENIDYKGNVYVYLTVTENTEIKNINVKSYPNSNKINKLIKKAVTNIKVKKAKYNSEIVKARLWTYFTFPSSSKELFSETIDRLNKERNPKYENYEKVILDATEYIFSNPIYSKSKQFISATKIVGYWVNKKTEMNIPTFGKFFTSLTNKNQQQFLYTVAMINYQLNQKFNNKRILKCTKNEGEKYSEQKDVKEVQIEGAKILLDFIGNEKNNVPVNSKTKKYLKAHIKKKLEKIFYKK